MIERCIQCERTIAPGNEEYVVRNFDTGEPDILILHRGGCPRPDPITNEYPTKENPS